MKTKTITIPNLLALAVLVLLAAEAKAQGDAGDHAMLDQVRAGWKTLIFVSSAMPRQSLVELAREASLARATLVLRGMPQPADPTAPLDFQQLGGFAAQINAACCKTKGPGWIVDPRLFERYGVQAAPTFVLAWGESASSRDFSRVEGDMGLANALKYFAQQSGVPAIRVQATETYGRAFGGQP